MKEQLSINTERLWQAAADLINSVGWDGELIPHALMGGANNRVFRVDVNGARALLKAYFQHPSDPRNRLDSEFSFSSFAWENGVRSLPRPLACDLENRLGLYEFVEGRQLFPSEVTEGAVRQALNFYFELNHYRLQPAAMNLPLASEACFSIADHLRCVEYRMQNLSGVDDSSAVGRDAASFIRNELSGAWGHVADSVSKLAGDLGLLLGDEIALMDKRLSPSDFGFHNALLTADGHLRFIDFEYAGWDDPAKMVCDFFCQPAVPVPLAHFEMFTEMVVADLAEPERHRQRIALLFPVYQIKWCCILLNEFLPVGSKRRRFASSTVDQEEKKAGQLQKARRALQQFASEQS